jgi:hypothetical protein
MDAVLETQDRLAQFLLDTADDILSLNRLRPIHRGSPHEKL